MDFASQIRAKRDDFKRLRGCEGIDAVLRHLDAAERHFERGKELGDADLFTDVVYRTNHVFEGILKEAYQVLAGKKLGKVTPEKIESYFSKNKVFSSRVIEYFKRYRQDWRNPSTHDYRLDFDEQEAFLAISTVSAFCYVSLDQMIRNLALHAAEKIVEDAGRMLSRDALDGKTLANFIADQLPRLMYEFSSRDVGPISEVAMLGAIEGAFRSFVPFAETYIEPALKLDGNRLRPDLLLQDNGKNVVIEIKRIPKKKVKEFVLGPRIREQLMMYSRAAGTTEAIGLLLPSESILIEDEMFEVTAFEEAGTHIFIVHPRFS